MNHKDLNSITQSLQIFMTTDPACTKAISHLGKGVEIGVVIEKQIECALGKGNDGNIFFEIRPAKSPDITFELTASAADFLANQKDLDLGTLGVEVLKQYLNHELRIRVNGNLWNILKNGYLGIVKDAGAPFAKFLAEHGVANISKIPDIIKRLKK